MQSIPRALFWEFSRRGWWRLLLAQAAVLSLVVLVYSALLRTGPLDAATCGGVYVVLAGIAFVTITGAALAAHGDPRRLYLLPLSNWELSIVAILPGAVSVAALYTMTAIVVNARYGAGWPEWGTAACFATGFAALRAAAQLAGVNRLLRFLAWCAVAIPLTNWWRARFGGGWFLAPRTMWHNVTLGDWLSICLVFVAACLAMTHAIARDRRGDSAWGALLSGWPRVFARRTPRDAAPFRDARAAQFWFEWKQKGMILPATFFAFLAFLLAGCACGVFQNPQYELLHGLLGYYVAFAPLSLVTGLVLGHVELSQAHVECGPLLGTRPMTCAGLTAALFRAEVVSLLVTWALWCAAALGATILLYGDQGAAPVLDLWTDHGRYQQQFAALGVWYAVNLAVLMLISAWIAMTLATSLVLTGRQRLVIGCAVVGVALLLVLAYASEHGIRLRGDVWQMTCGAAAITATLVLFVFARRKSLIDWSTCGTALAVWLTLCALGGGVSWWLQSVELAHCLFAAGLLTFAAAPLALGPAALAWNRHR
jgi:hypothetical protein